MKDERKTKKQLIEELVDLRRQLTDGESSGSGQTERSLEERVKELTCLYAVSRDMQADISIDEFCRRVIEHLVPAMQFPEIAVPVIELGNMRFVPKNYADDLRHSLNASINVGGGNKGQLWVYYSEDRPFLIPEEQNLINGVAESLSIWLERGMAGEALASSEAELRATLYGIGDGVIATDVEGRLARMNPVAERLTGWAEQEAIGQPLEQVLNLVHEKTRRPVDSPVARVLREGEVIDLVSHTMLISRDGSEHPIADAGAPILDLQGNTVGAVLVFRDQTEERLSQRILETRLSLIEYAASHTLQELLTRSLDEVGAFVDSPIGFYHFVEPDQETLSLQQWSTRTLQEFCQAEGRGLHYSIGQAGVWVDCVRQMKPVVHNDYESLPHKKGMPDGHAMVVRELVVPVMRDEKVVAILGVGNKPSDYSQRDVEIVTYLADVTWEIVRQRRAEEALRQSESRTVAVFRAAPVGIGVVSDRAFVDVNDRFCEIVGYSRDELVGESARVVYPSDEDYEFVGSEKYRQIKERGTGAVETLFRRKDGRIIDVLLSSTPFSPDDLSAGVVFTALDITERKQTEGILGRQNEYLSALQETTLELISQLDLGTLLENIVKRAGMLVGTTSGFLDLVDPETGQLEPHVGVGALSESLNHKVQLGEGLAGMVWQTGEPLVINDYDQWLDRINGFSYGTLGSIIGVPLLSGGQVLGVLGLAYEVTSERTFGPEEIDLLIQFGRLATIAMENTRLFSAAQQELAERTRAEEAMRESEERYRQLFEMESDAIFLIDNETGQIIEANRAASIMYGFDQEELLSKKNTDLSAEPEETQRVTQGTPIVSDDLVLIPLRWHRRKDGSVFPVEIAGRFFEWRGRPVHVAAIRDITERRRADEALLRHTAQLEALQRVGLELSAELDLNTLLSSIVATALNLFKVSSGGLYLYREDRDVLEWTVAVGPISAPVGTILHRGEGLSGKVWESGEPIIVDDYSQWEGRAEIYEGYPFKAIMAVPVRWGGDLLGVVNVMANDVGVFSPEDADLLKLFAAQAGVAIRNASLLEQARREIARRERVEEQLQAYTEQLEHLVEEKVLQLDEERAKVVHTARLASLGEMASGVAHELNQPLTAILLEGEYLMHLAEPVSEEIDRSDPNMGELRRLGENIVADVGRCRRIIDHLRTFSRTSEQEPVPISLNQPIEDALILVGRRLAEHDVEARLQLDPDLPLVLADLHRLEQVFLNLITNAEYGLEEMSRRVKTGEAERAGYSKRLDISTFVEGESVVAVVRDNGCGIARQDWGHVFEPFFTTKPVGQGTGLGLSISYGIVTGFGGEIGFESEENVGTVFTLRFTPAPEGSVEH